MKEFIRRKLRVREYYKERQLKDIERQSEGQLEKERFKMKQSEVVIEREREREKEREIIGKRKRKREIKQS